MKRSSHGIMAKVLDCGLEVSEFKLHSHNYIYFQTTPHEKGVQTNDLLNCIVNVM